MHKGNFRKHLAKTLLCGFWAGCFCIGLHGPLKAQAQKACFYRGIRLHEGDLIFQQACGGETEAAIKSVTSSARGYAFTHVGMVCFQEGEAFVLEATVPCVRLCPLEEFLSPDSGTCRPVSVLARLKPRYRALVPEALRRGMAHLGKSYDYGYVLGNDRYYCSELIYQILKDANGGEEVFPLNVMTFSDTSGFLLPAWEAYFRQHSVPVPEGEPGINPGAMSRSGILRLFRRRL